MIFIEQLLNNHVLSTSALSWLMAQIIKVIIDIVRYKKFDLSVLIGSGGMPSSHSSLVTALSTSIGLYEGFNSNSFAIATVLSLIVMYDAAGVRRAAGKQAEILNLMLEKIENHGITVDKKLKELLGHSPIEVTAGALLGITIALLMYR